MPSRHQMRYPELRRPGTAIDQPRRRFRSAAVALALLALVALLGAVGVCQAGPEHARASSSDARAAGGRPVEAAATPSPAARRKAPDLLVSRLSEPPASVRAGEVLKVTDAVKNAGATKAKPSLTRYYLSGTPKMRRGAQRLAGGRSVPALRASKSSRGRATLSVPTGASAGVYHLVACADDLLRIPERDERNNCRASRRRVSVSKRPPPPSQPPAAPEIDDHPPALTNATGASFRFTGSEPGLAFRCQLDGGAFEDCQSPKAYAGPLAEGPHVFSVLARDRAGRQSPATAFGWRIDTTPPAAPEFAVRPEALTRDREAEVSFTGSEPGLAFRCRLDDAEATPCESPHRLSGLADGEHTLEVRARDAAGNESEAASVRWRIDATPPSPPRIDARPDDLTNSTRARFEFSAAESGVAFRCRLDDAEATPCESPHRLSGLADGEHTLEVRARDAAGNESEAASARWRIDATPPSPPRIDARPDEETRARTARFAFSSDELGASFRCRLDGGPHESCESPRDLSGLADGEHTFEVRARDDVGNESEAAAFTWRVDPAAPPRLDPPPVDETTATTVADSTRFLYTGEGAVQSGVAPKTIDPKRAAVVRGLVKTRSGDPLSGVRVTVLDHPELGETMTRRDGRFDLAVNGGGPLTLVYGKAGHLPAQRQVEAPWQDFAVADDVVMVGLDDRVEEIDPASTEEVQVARGSEVRDDDGSRRSTLLFPKGTEAEMVLPGGERRALGAFHVRSTEYTAGERGPEAMPAELPPTSGYTYAAELSVDEALRAGATDVRFSQPVLSYVENFLDFPVGTPVPAGYYDRARGQWVASKDGKVIKVLGEAEGKADLDTDGDGDADTNEELAALGVTDAERERLASLYEPGQTLWRVPVTHFTPWDYNWPYGPPRDAKAPQQEDPEPDTRPDCQSTQAGSVIGCEGQTLGEKLALTGSPFGLSYRSDRAPGRKASYSLRIPLTGSRVPESLRRIVLEVSVAGRRFRETFPAGPNQTHTFTWDGRDAYGRVVQGAQPVTTKLGYVYGAVYQRPQPFAQGAAPAFALPSGVSITADRARREITLWQDWRGQLGVFDARGQGLGGWSLDVHHAYEPRARILHLGTGGRRTAQEIADAIITTAAGTGAPGDVDEVGDGGPATKARLRSPLGVDVASDGSLYLSSGNRIRRVSPNGTITTVAGNGEFGFAGDGAPATKARLRSPMDVAVAPDGSLYIADTSNNRIRRVGPGGVITTVAGDGRRASDGDGGPATQAGVASPRGVAVGPDGSLYIAGTEDARVRRVGPDGMITTVAGNGVDGFAGDGGPATRAQLWSPWDVAVGPDGSLYIADGTNHRVRRVAPDGMITTVAGGGGRGAGGDGGPATRAQLETPARVDVAADGSLYIADIRTHRVRRVGPDGLIRTVAGDGRIGFGGDGGPATRAPLGGALNAPTDGPYGVALAPDGSLYVADTWHHRIRRVAPSLPGLALGDMTIASEDGSELFVFDPAGRHLRTVDALTGAVTWRFRYEQGRLAEVEDRDGRVTRIERDGAGTATAIVAPGGQRTTLEVNGDGYLTRVANPANEATKLSYDPGGLISTRTDPKGGVHRFTYDGLGRLTKDEDSAEGSKTLSRTETGRGYKVAVRTALGRESTYEVERLPAGGERRVRTDPSGARTEALTGTDGRASVSRPDGTTVSTELGPDPRFGMQSPVLSKLTERTPAGRTRTTTEERGASLANPADPTSARSLTTKVSVNGRSSTQTFDAGTRTLTSTSPAGRSSSAVLDERGRVARATLAAGIEPITYGYDERGRLAEAKQGPQGTKYAYDEQDRVVSVTDAADRTVRYGYDRADRVTELKLPSGKTYGFAYDDNGNRTEVRMPTGAIHRLEHTSLDQERSYTPPGGEAMTHSYDRDRNPTETKLPDGRAIESSYDDGGRPKGSKYDEAAVALDYADATDRVKSLRRTPAGDGPAQESGFSYDGGLLASTSLSGAAEGRFDYGYDHNLFRTGSKLTSGSETFETPLGRDPDGLLTKIGPFGVAREGPGGAPSELGDGTLKTTLGYDSLARPEDRTHAVAGEEVYKLALGFDDAGRIAEKTEQVGEATHTYDYRYDPDGQLTRVERDGEVVERYAYDENGNRTARQLGEEPVETAAYDAQDRLTRRGSTAYEFDEDGFLRKRGDDTFRYSARGELLEAKVGDRTVTYAYDALGRRVERREGNRRIAYLYGNPDEPFQVTATKDQTGALTTLHYDEQGLLIALERAGRRYYVATDQVGTPRLVATADGHVVKRLDWNSVGVLTHDSNPGFELPLGFAGGLHDQLTGLTRFGFRDYEAAAGRWTARDPIGFDSSDINLYRYAANDPINYVDPDGLDIYDWAYRNGIADWDIQGRVTDAIVGFGDGASFGRARWLRENLTPAGTTGVDCSSLAYRGGFWTGAAWTSTGIGLRLGAALGRTRAFHGLNHNRWLRLGPGRMGKRGLFKNVNGPRLSIGPQRAGVESPWWSHWDLRVRFFD